MTDASPEPIADAPVGEKTVNRVAYLTLVIGVAAGLSATAMRRFDWAEGLVAGAGLGWLNFRWLRRGVEALTSAAVGTEPGAQKRRGSAATFLTALFRYALIGLSVYVIFKYLHVPLVSIVLGLCALAAAIIVASVWEILQSTT